MKTRFISRIDHFNNLEIEFAEDGFKKSVIEHEYPNKNGAQLENMGTAADRHRFVVWFYGDDPDHGYDKYQEFYQYIRENRKISWIHPEEGQLHGEIVQTFRKFFGDQNVGIECTFVEEGLTDATLERGIHISAEVDQEYMNNMQHQMAAFAAKAENEIGPEARSILSQPIDYNLPIIDQFSGVSMKARKWLKDIDEKVSLFEDSLNELSVPADSVINEIDFGTGLAGRVVSTIAKFVERNAAAITSVRDNPYRWSNIFLSGFERIKSSVGSLQIHVESSIAVVGATNLATIYAEDETRRDQVRNLETSPAFDKAGNFLTAQEYPQIANLLEIENSLFNIRLQIQNTIDLIRTQNVNGSEEQISSLKMIASKLTDYVNQIKIEREKIKEIVVDPWMPLHIICIKNNLPYTYAERIMRLNKIENPTFTSGKLLIYEK